MDAGLACPWSGLVCLVPAAPSAGRVAEKGRPVRTCLRARGPVLGILLTLWFQHYFRKKRSLQKSTLKKYEPLLVTLASPILILNVEGKFSDCTVILSCSNHTCFAESFPFPQCPIQSTNVSTRVTSVLCACFVAQNRLLVWRLFSSQRNRVTERAASGKPGHRDTEEVRELQRLAVSRQKQIWGRDS